MPQGEGRLALAGKGSSLHTKVVPTRVSTRTTRTPRPVPSVARSVARFYGTMIDEPWRSGSDGARRKLTQPDPTPVAGLGLGLGTGGLGDWGLGRTEGVIWLRWDLDLPWIDLRSRFGRSGSGRSRISVLLRSDVR